MSDSIQLIDRIFKRLGATYGEAWDRSLGQAPIADVKTVWAHDLEPFLQNKAAMGCIAWALENLPDRCPNVREFVSLCRQTPRAEVPALPMPAPNPERMRQELAKMTQKPAQSHDPKAWAHRILERHKAGEKISPTVVQMARQGLGMEA